MAARAPPHPTASSSSPRVRLARARAAAALPSSSPSRRASRTSDPASRSRAPILDDDTNNVDRNPNATTSHPIDRWRADARSTSRSMKLANDRSRRRSRVRWGRKGVRGPGPGHDWSSSISRSFEATGVASACDGVVVVVVVGGGTVRRETRTGATKKKNQTPRACV